MAKEEVLTFEGMIDEILPDGRFRVELENGHRLIAYTAGRMRRLGRPAVVGDAGRGEKTPKDLTKGRIVYRDRGPGSPGAASKRR